MNVKKALMVSPVKQAIRDEGTGPMVIVTVLQSRAYYVSAKVGTSVFLSEIVPDEKAVEQVLWDRLGMLPILFAPMQMCSPVSPLRPSALAMPEPPSPQREQKHVPPCNHKRLLQRLYFLVSQLLREPRLVFGVQDLLPSWLRARWQCLSGCSRTMVCKLPREAYQLAETYQLGTPVKRHMNLGWIIVGSCLVTYFFLGGVVATFAPPGLEPSMALIYIGVIVVNIILVFKMWSHYAYECTDGFVVLTRKTRQVKHVLHWNEVLSTHTAGAHGALHYVTDIHQQTIEVPYYDLWKRCEDAVARSTR